MNYPIRTRLGPVIGLLDELCHPPTPPFSLSSRNFYSTLNTVTWSSAFDHAVGGHPVVTSVESCRCRYENGGRPPTRIRLPSTPSTCYDKRESGVSLHSNHSAQGASQICARSRVGVPLTIRTKSQGVGVIWGTVARNSRLSIFPLAVVGSAVTSHTCFGHL